MPVNKWVFCLYPGAWKFNIQLNLRLNLQDRTCSPQVMGHRKGTAFVMHKDPFDAVLPEATFTSWPLFPRCHFSLFSEALKFLLGARVSHWSHCIAFSAQILLVLPGGFPTCPYPAWPFITQPAHFQQTPTLSDSSYSIPYKNSEPRSKKYRVLALPYTPNKSHQGLGSHMPSLVKLLHMPSQDCSWYNHTKLLIVST